MMPPRVNSTSTLLEHVRGTTLISRAFIPNLLVGCLMIWITTINVKSVMKIKVRSVWLMVSLTNVIVGSAYVWITQMSWGIPLQSSLLFSSLLLLSAVWGNVVLPLGTDLAFRAYVNCSFILIFLVGGVGTGGGIEEAPLQVRGWGVWRLILVLGEIFSEVFACASAQQAARIECVDVACVFQMGWSLPGMQLNWCVDVACVYQMVWHLFSKQVVSVYCAWRAIVAVVQYFPLVEIVFHLPNGYLCLRFCTTGCEDVKLNTSHGTKLMGWSLPGMQLNWCVDVACVYQMVWHLCLKQVFAHKSLYRAINRGGRSLLFYNTSHWLRYEPLTGPFPQATVMLSLFSFRLCKWLTARHRGDWWNTGVAMTLALGGTRRRVGGWGEPGQGAGLGERVEPPGLGEWDEGQVLGGW
ncbi:hypothetical protein VP01_1660g5 [Puccinia sorghi]|uniref:Uncharacterized protein n=1 Tax=Puccinia sorghi TaxID=27349 RepID=A0A0L6VGB6_9BASI|nr:hypothetical protein VP01_1660g5 [Puccinia sorghi]